jgi:hypothetical protein
MSKTIATVLAFVLTVPSSVLAQAITGAIDKPQESAPFASSVSFSDLRASLERAAARLSRDDMAAAAAAKAAAPSDRSWAGRHPVALGVLIGAAAGTIWGAFACSSGGCKADSLTGPLVAIGAGVGAGIGAGIGAVVSIVRR